MVIIKIVIVDYAGGGGDGREQFNNSAEHFSAVTETGNSVNKLSRRQLLLVQKFKVTCCSPNILHLYVAQSAPSLSKFCTFLN